MKKTRKLIIATFLLLIILGGAGAVLADEANNKLHIRNKTERQQTTKRAINTNDYNLWKQLMGNRPIAQKINQQNFSKFVEMHNQMKAGNFNEANKIRQELGLGSKNKKNCKKLSHTKNSP
jgi:hypothetical protein